MTDPMWTDTMVNLPDNFLADRLPQPIPREIEVSLNGGVPPAWEGGRRWAQSKVVLWWHIQGNEREFLDCGRVPVVEVAWQLQLPGYHPGIMYSDGNMRSREEARTHTYSWGWHRA